MADILLKLSKCSFPEIGSLVEIDEFEYSVSGRAMTLNTNELVQLGNFPQSPLANVQLIYFVSSGSCKHTYCPPIDST
jgi:hypothetical protein